MTENRKLVLGLYRKLFPVQLLSFISMAFINLAGGAYIGKMLGQQELAAFGIASTMMALATTFGNGCAASAVLLCGKAICRQDEAKMNQIYSVSLMTSLGLGVLLMLLCWITPNGLGVILGASKDIRDLTQKSLFGISFSLPILCVIPVVTYFLQLRCEEKKTILSSFLMMLVFGAVLPVSIMIGFQTMFFASLAIAVAAGACWVYQIYTYHAKEHYFFRFSDFSRQILRDILFFGMSTMAGAYFGLVKRIAFNWVTVKIGGVDTLATYTIVNNISACLQEMLIPAAVNCSFMIVSIFFAEKDRVSMKRFVKTSLNVYALLGLLCAVIVIPLARPIAQLFGATDLKETAFALYMLGLSAIPFSVTNFLLAMCSAQKRARDISLICFVEQIVLGGGSVLIFSMVLGVRGIWISCVIGELLSVGFSAFYASIYKRRPIRSILELVCIPADFGADSKKSFHATVNSAQQVVGLSKRLVEQCTKNGVSARVAKKAGLCVEEITANIAEHGFSKDELGNAHLIDVTVIQEKKNIRLIIRDDCVPFDPKKRFVQMDPDDPCRGIGIRMVMNVAKKVEYKSVFGLNVLTVTLAE